MKQLLSKLGITKESITILQNEATDNEWCYIEESLIMAKFKADLNLKKDLFDALEWPLTRAEYINYLRNFKKWVPRKSNESVWRTLGVADSQEVYDKLCHFYYLVDQQTGIGKLVDSIPWFSEFLVTFADNWGDFLGSEESFDEEIITSYLKNSPKYRIQDSLKNGKPNTPWNCFNDFFARELNPGLRAIDNPDNNQTITTPADSTFKQKQVIDCNSNIPKITIKQTHSFENIPELLKNSKYSESFSNGTLAHYVLGPYSYHRMHAPVCGLVKESYPIYGLTYLAITIEENGEFGTVENTADGYQFSQARGVLTIDTSNSPYGDMGIVAVLPIGMCTISSVHMLATPDTTLEKGEEFGYFKFGGSDVILLFQEGKAPLIDDCEGYRHYGNSISKCPDKEM